MGLEKKNFLTDAERSSCSMPHRQSLERDREISRPYQWQCHPDWLLFARNLLVAFLQQRASVWILKGSNTQPGLISFPLHD